MWLSHLKEIGTKVLYILIIFKNTTEAVGRFQFLPLTYFTIIILTVTFSHNISAGDRFTYFDLEVSLFAT